MPFHRAQKSRFPENKKLLTYPEAADNPPCLVKGQSHHHPWIRVMFERLAVLGIRIRRIRMFLDLPDPEQDPLVRGKDPHPSHFSFNTKFLQKKIFKSEDDVPAGRLLEKNMKKKIIILHPKGH
jgi:hypothetical protein